MIADNVGDNVGDDAGMAADLFETYAVTVVASMFLGALLRKPRRGDAAAAPGARFSIPASIVGTLMVRLWGGISVISALYVGVIVSAVLSALIYIPVIADTAKHFGPFTAGASSTKIYFCGLIGLVITALIVAITEYYTGTRFGPVKRISEQSLTGHATNIIAGLAVGMQATALPVIVIAVGTVTSFKLAGIYGIAIAVTSMLSMAGMVVALDAFGPITDNAGGIAEMADLPARGSRQGHRPAGRGRQHHQGGHQGLRDRLGRPGGAGAVPVLQRRAGQEAGAPGHVHDQRPVGAGRPADRRPDAVPVRVARDGRGRAHRRRSSSRRCGASSARSPGSWRAPPSPTTPAASTW